MLTQHLFYIGEDSDVTSNNNRNEEHVNAMVDVNFQNRFSSLPRLKKTRHVFYNDMSEENNDIKRGRRTYGGRDMRTYSYEYNNKNEKNENKTLQNNQRLKVDPSCLFFGTDTKKTDLGESFTNLHKSIGSNTSSKDSITTSLSCVDTRKTVKHSTSDSQKYFGFNSTRDNLSYGLSTAKGDVLNIRELVLETKSIPLQTKNIENVNQNSQSQLDGVKSHAEHFGNVMIQNEDTTNTLSVNNILTVDSPPVKTEGAMAGGTDIIKHNTCSNMPSADQRKNDNSINTVNFNGISEKDEVSHVTSCENKNRSMHTKERIMKRTYERSMQGDTSLLTMSKGNMSFYCPSKQIDCTSLYDNKNNSDDAKKVFLKQAYDKSLCGEDIGVEKHVKQVDDCDLVLVGDVLVESDISSGQEISDTRGSLCATLKGNYLNAGLIDDNILNRNNRYNGGNLTCNLLDENTSSDGLNGDDLNLGSVDSCLDINKNIFNGHQVDNVPGPVLITKENTKSGTSSSLNPAIFAQSNISTRQYSNNYASAKNDNLFNDDANSVLNHDRNAINEVFNNLTSGSYGFLSKANELIEKLELPSQSGSSDVLLDKNSNIVSDNLDLKETLLEKNFKTVSNDLGLNCKSLSKSQNIEELAKKEVLTLNDNLQNGNLHNGIKELTKKENELASTSNDNLDIGNLHNDNILLDNAPNTETNKQKELEKILHEKNELNTTLCDSLQNENISLNDIPNKQTDNREKIQSNEICTSQKDIPNITHNDINPDVNNKQKADIAQNGHVESSTIIECKTGKQKYHIELELTKNKGDITSKENERTKNKDKNFTNSENNSSSDENNDLLSKPCDIQNTELLGEIKDIIEQEEDLLNKQDKLSTININTTCKEQADLFQERDLIKPCSVPDKSEDKYIKTAQDQDLIRKQDETSTINSTCKEQANLFQEKDLSKPCLVQENITEEKDIQKEHKSEEENKHKDTSSPTKLTTDSNLEINHPNPNFETDCLQNLISTTINNQVITDSVTCNENNVSLCNINDTCIEEAIQNEHNSEEKNELKGISSPTKLTTYSNLEFNHCRIDSVQNCINNQVITDSVTCNKNNVSLCNINDTCIEEAIQNEHKFEGKNDLRGISSPTNLTTYSNLEFNHCRIDSVQNCISNQVITDSVTCDENNVSLCNINDTCIEEAIQNEHNSEEKNELKGPTKLTTDSNLELNHIRIDSLQTINNQAPCNENNVSLCTSNLLNDKNNKLLHTSDNLNSQIYLDGEVCQIASNSRQQFNNCIQQNIPGTLFEGFNTISDTTCNNTKNDEDENENGGGLSVGRINNNNLLVNENKYIEKDIPGTFVDRINTNCNNTFNGLKNDEIENAGGLYEDIKTTSNFLADEKELEDCIGEMTDVEHTKNDAIEVLAVHFQTKIKDNNLTDKTNSEEYFDEKYNEELTEITCKETNSIIEESKADILVKNEKEHSKNHLKKKEENNDASKKRKNSSTINTHTEITNNTEKTLKDPKDDVKKDPSIQLDGNLDTGLMFGNTNKGEGLLPGITVSDGNINIHDEGYNQEMDVIDCEIELTNNEVISCDTVKNDDYMDLNVGCKQESIVNDGKKLDFENDESVKDKSENKCAIDLLLKDKSDDAFYDGLLTGNEANLGLNIGLKNENLVHCNDKADFGIDEKLKEESNGGVDLLLKRKSEVEFCDKHSLTGLESKNIDTKPVDSHNDMDKKLCNGNINEERLKNNNLSNAVQKDRDNIVDVMNPIEEPCTIELTTNQEQALDADADASGSDSESLGSEFDLQDHIDKSKTKRSERETRIRTAFSFVLGLLSDSDDEVDVPVHDKLNRYARNSSTDSKKRNGSFKEDLLRGSIKFLSSDSSVDEDDVTIRVNGKPSQEEVTLALPVNNQQSLSGNVANVPVKGQLLQDEVDLGISGNGQPIKEEAVVPVLEDCQLLQDDNLLQSLDEIIAFSSPISSPFNLEKNESNFNIVEDSINLQSEVEDSRSSTITDNNMLKEGDDESTNLSNSASAFKNGECTLAEKVITSSSTCKNVNSETTNGLLTDEVDKGTKVEPFSTNINEELTTINSNPKTDLLPNKNLLTEEQRESSETINSSEDNNERNEGPTKGIIGSNGKAVLENDDTSSLESNSVSESGSVSKDMDVTEGNSTVDIKDELLSKVVSADTTTLDKASKVVSLFVNINPENELVSTNTLNTDSVLDVEPLLVPVTMGRNNEQGLIKEDHIVKEEPKNIVLPIDTQNIDSILHEESILVPVKNNTGPNRNLETIENEHNAKEEKNEIVPSEDVFHKSDITILEPDYDYDYYEPSSTGEIDSSSQIKELNISFQKKIDLNIDIVDNDKVIIEIISLLIDQVDDIFKSVNNEKIASRNSSFTEKELVSDIISFNDEDLSSPQIDFDIPDTNINGSIPDDEESTTKTDILPMTYADICKGKPKSDILGTRNKKENALTLISRDENVPYNNNFNEGTKKESLGTDNDNEEQLTKIYNERDLNLEKCVTTMGTNNNELVDTNTQQCTEKDEVSENIIKPLISAELKSDNPSDLCEKYISLQKYDNLVSKCITNTTDLIIVDNNNDIADILNVSPIINVDVKPQVPTTTFNTKRRKSKGDTGKVYPQCANDYQLIAFGHDDTRVENHLSLFIKETDIGIDDGRIKCEKDLMVPTENSSKQDSNFNKNKDSKLDKEGKLNDQKDSEIKETFVNNIVNEFLDKDKQLDTIITEDLSEVNFSSSIEEGGADIKTKENAAESTCECNNGINEEIPADDIIAVVSADIVNKVINHTLNVLAKTNENADNLSTKYENEISIKEAEKPSDDIIAGISADIVNKVINHTLNVLAKTDDDSSKKLKNEISIKKEEESRMNHNLNENSHYTGINIEGSNTTNMENSPHTDIEGSITTNMTSTDINSSYLHKGDVSNPNNSETEQISDVYSDDNMMERTPNVGNFEQENIACDDIPIEDRETPNNEDCMNINFTHTKSSDLLENLLKSNCKVSNNEDCVDLNLTHTISRDLLENLPKSNCKVSNNEDCVDLNLTHSISSDLLKNKQNYELIDNLSENAKNNELRNDLLEDTLGSVGINQNSVIVTNLDGNICANNNKVETASSDNIPITDFDHIPLISTEQAKIDGCVDLDHTPSLSSNLPINKQGNYDNCVVVTNLDDSNLCNSSNKDDSNSNNKGDSNRILVKEEVFSLEDENKSKMELQMEDLFDGNSVIQVLDQYADLSHTKDDVLDKDQSSDQKITFENKGNVEKEAVGSFSQSNSEVGKNIVIRRKSDQLISFDETDGYCDISIKDTKHDSLSPVNNTTTSDTFDILIPESKPNEFTESTEKSMDPFKNIKSFDSFDILDDFTSSPALVNRNSSFNENDNNVSDIDNDSFELFGYSSEILDMATSLIDDSNLLIVEESFTSIDNKTKNTLNSINDVSNLLDDSTLLIDDSADLLDDASALMEGTKSLISDSTASVDDLLASISQMKPSRDFTKKDPNSSVINEKDTNNIDVVLVNDQTDPSLISDITTLINNTSTLLSDFHSLSDNFDQTGLIETRPDINNILNKQSSDVIVENLVSQEDLVLKDNSLGSNNHKNENILNVLDKKECLTNRESSFDIDFKGSKDDKLLQNDTNGNQVSPYVELENPYDTLQTSNSEKVLTTPCEELKNTLNINEDQPNMEIVLPNKDLLPPNMELLHPNLEPETPFEIVENPYKEFETPNKDFHISYKLTTPNLSITDNLMSGSDNSTSGSDNLTSGSDKLTSGYDKLASGSDKLTSGSDKLTSGSDKLMSGSDKLTSGSDKLTSDSEKLTSVSDTSHFESDCSSDSEEEKEGYQTVLDRFNALIGSRK